MSREIINADAIKWLSEQQDKSLDHVVTGICDMNEMKGMDDMDKYLNFFRSTATLILQKVKGYAIFIQTDRKHNRSWIDKSYHLTDVALSMGFKMLWHKIVLRRAVDATDLHRPTYSHMLCFSVAGNPGSATPDVIPVSKSLYSNGTPFEAAKRAIEFIKTNSKKDNVVVVDPFVGKGTIVAVANAYGLNAIGIDIDASQCKEAQQLYISKK
jgi:hypothetical protein